MAGAVRIRDDVWKLSVGTLAAARTQPWDPVLDGYARGVEAMVARDDALTADSWLWAANTHNAPPGTPANPMWKQCAHHKRFFLPWHRGYLAWFEATIQTLIGDDDWALPYWDYSDPNNPNALKVPPEFKTDKRTVNGVLVDNPLFLSTQDRPGQPDPLDVDLLPAMTPRFFVRRPPATGFGGSDGPENRGGAVETQPHDFVHGDIGGGTGFMRTTTLAARDPIFWLHHANIDRLWEVWHKLPGSVELINQGGVPAATVTEWNSAAFAFGDPGAPVVYQMHQLADTTADPLRYRYRDTDLPPNVLAAVTARRQGGPMGLDEHTPRERRWDPLAATEGVDVGTDGAQRALQFDAGQLGLAGGVPSALVIELTGVRAAADCHNVYFVDVAARDGAPTHRAGRFSTFGLSGTPADEERDYVVDASAAIPALVADNWNGRGLVVAVSPDRESGGSSEGDDGIQIRQITVLSPR
jgi:tyrosinase